MLTSTSRQDTGGGFAALRLRICFAFRRLLARCTAFHEEVIRLLIRFVLSSDGGWPWRFAFHALTWLGRRSGHLLI